MDLLFELIDLGIDRTMERVGRGLQKGPRRRSVDAGSSRSRRRTSAGSSNTRESGCSFSADTTVATAEGDVAIAEIAVGDMILGYSEESGDVDVYRVLATHIEQHDSTLDLTIDGEVVHTTATHPFYGADGGWIDAGDLTLGDTVIAADGTVGTVEGVAVVDAPQVMYNLTVDLVATYVVGAGQWVCGGHER